MCVFAVEENGAILDVKGDCLKTLVEVGRRNEEAREAVAEVERSRLDG